ncbi:Hypothetical predicted protein [Marmota monax]|uniref:Uncharacterized protein n=1 Tax=Marmota monax TaxID=9995 RepID=A0A5E4BNY0_MARMO|nr:hypothetical protein GHT09_007950 [Marmota monax]VTJ71135.1 Hypothetical predicted protein [Marmota monax]
MSQRQVLQVFEQYQKARTQFVQMVAELATRPQNIETLQNAGELDPRPSPVTPRAGPSAWQYPSPPSSPRADLRSLIPARPRLCLTSHSPVPWPCLVRV